MNRAAKTAGTENPKTVKDHAKNKWKTLIFNGSNRAVGHLLDAAHQHSEKSQNQVR